MASDWKNTVKQLLTPIQKTDNPFEVLDSVVKSLSEEPFRRTIPKAIADLETALNQKESLSFLIQVPHSEELVRDYLYDVLNELKKVKVAPVAASPSSSLPPNAQRPKKEKLLIAVDFDGTIVEHRYPEIGPPIPGALETLKALQDAGHRLILFTCREDESDGTGRRYLSEAVNFCKERGINFVGANATPTGDDFRPMGGRKVYADVYIDDRNLGGFPGWTQIKRLLLG